MMNSQDLPWLSPTIPWLVATYIHYICAEGGEISAHIEDVCRSDGCQELKDQSIPDCSGGQGFSYAHTEVSMHDICPFGDKIIVGKILLVLF